MAQLNNVCQNLKTVLNINDCCEILRNLASHPPTYYGFVLERVSPTLITTPTLSLPTNMDTCCPQSAGRLKSDLLSHSIDCRLTRDGGEGGATLWPLHSHCGQQPEVTPPESWLARQRWCSWTGENGPTKLETLSSEKQKG